MKAQAWLGLFPCPLGCHQIQLSNLAKMMVVESKASGGQMGNSRPELSPREIRKGLELELRESLHHEVRLMLSEADFLKVELNIDVILAFIQHF